MHKHLGVIRMPSCEKQNSGPQRAYIHCSTTSSQSSKFHKAEFMETLSKQIIYVLPHKRAHVSLYLFLIIIPIFYLLSHNSPDYLFWPGMEV